MEDAQIPPTDDQKKETAKIFKMGNILFIACIIYMGATGGLCLTGTVNLAGLHKLLA